MTGSIVLLLSGKAGCGKTTLAANLAVVLGDDGTNRVCLVDLDFDLGDIASILGLEAERTVISAMDGRGHLDSTVLKELLIPLAPGVDCLLAATQPGESDKIPPLFIEELLVELRSNYDYVVIDTPDPLTSHVLAALDWSDHHVLVTTPELPALKNLRRMLDMLDLLVPRASKRSIIANRWATDSGMAADQLEAIVKWPIAAALPASPDVPASVNGRVPLARSSPDHPIVAAVREFAASAIVAVDHPPYATVGRHRAFADESARPNTSQRRPLL